MSDQETIKNVWPDQWFVSDGLNIEGPLSAKEAFASVEKVSEIFKTIEKSVSLPDRYRIYASTEWCRRNGI
jgi:hypothetical protein